MKVCLQILLCITCTWALFGLTPEGWKYQGIFDTETDCIAAMRLFATEHQVCLQWQVYIQKVLPRNLKAGDK